MPDLRVVKALVVVSVLPCGIIATALVALKCVPFGRNTAIAALVGYMAVVCWALYDPNAHDPPRPGKRRGGGHYVPRYNRS